MRVLTIGSMYPPHHLGGYELMWRSAVRQMRAAGWDVQVLTTDYRSPEPPSDPEDPDVRRDLRWYWHDHAFPRMSLAECRDLERHNISVLRDAVEQHRPDALSWWAMGGMSLSLIEEGRRLGIPAAGAVVDDWMVYAPKVDGWSKSVRRLGLGPVAERLTGIPGRVDLGGAARWVFVSDYVRRRGVAAHPLPRTDVARGGVDRDLFTTALVREWDWSLLYVGRIDPRKGIDTAIRALEELPEAHLTVLGSGEDAHLRELEALVAELAVADRVEFGHRPRTELPAAYAAADVALFPVRWEEPWGLVPLEAMAVGRPVVATGTGGSGEYLEHERNCLRFAPGDHHGLAEAVRRLAGDPTLRARLRDHGTQTADHFTEPRYNRTVMDSLEQAVKEA
ncbi:MAG: glycosyltransferase family 1 protein [Frankiales bacterium]|nr:glycosyltransferase family 1 protein [Frankiales bacterium]